MTDDISTTSSPEPAPAPAPAPSPAPSSDIPGPVDDQVRESFAKGLDLMAKDENIEAYAAERADQDDFIDGKKFDEGRRAQWHRRAHDAVTKAAREAANAAGQMERAALGTTDQQDAALSQDRSYFPVTKLRTCSPKSGRTVRGRYDLPNITAMMLRENKRSWTGTPRWTPAEWWLSTTYTPSTGLKWPRF